MTVQGQGASQPGEGEAMSLESLANQLDSGDESPEESGEGEEVPEDAEVEDAEGEQPDEDAESEDADEPTFTIKFDGKEVSVKQSEAIELAQKGMDYTTKTMALAEERKALEPIKAQAEQARQRVEATLNESAGRLNAIVEFLTAELGEPPPIEWAAADASYFLHAKEQYESRKGKLEKAQQAAYIVQQEQVRQRDTFIRQQIAETEATLKSTLPDWSDAKVAELAKYIGEAGIDPNKSEMAFWTPGFWQLAHKAKAYDQLQAKKAEMKPVNQLPKVHKPTANNQPPQLAKRQEAMKAHKAKPSLKSLADLL